ncbi:hypothetical protein BC834DRAFT_149607 [Gloeopeniophorella convolvens]|nr:hypothetical protein BC834DRAFT_149607 [Gloeopeniophorella convolvens]
MAQPYHLPQGGIYSVLLVFSSRPCQKLSSQPDYSRLLWFFLRNILDAWFVRRSGHHRFDIKRSRGLAWTSTSLPSWILRAFSPTRSSHIDNSCRSCIVSHAQVRRVATSTFNAVLLPQNNPSFRSLFVTCGLSHTVWCSWSKMCRFNVSKSHRPPLRTRRGTRIAYRRLTFSPWYNLLARSFVMQQHSPTELVRQRALPSSLEDRPRAPVLRNQLIK